MLSDTLRRTRRPLAYSTLHEPQPAGPSIGSFDGQDIPSMVIDSFGRRFAYAGAAPRRPDGSLDDDALRPGEFFLLPGLVYRIVAKSR